MPVNTASNLPIINKYHYPFNDKEDAFIESEIQNLLKKGAIGNSSHELGEFISPIFLREKSDGGYRPILNSKKTKWVSWIQKVQNGDPSHDYTIHKTKYVYGQTWY